MKSQMRAMQISFFTLSITYLVYTPRIPQLKDRLGVSVSTLGSIFMIVGLMGLLTSKLVAKIIALVSSKKAILLALPNAMFGSVLIALSHRIIFFILGLVILSFSAFLLNTAVNTQANNFRHKTGDNQLNNLSAIANIGSLFAMVIGSVFLKVFTSTQYIIGLQALAVMSFLVVNRNLIKGDVATGEGEKAKLKLPWWNEDRDIRQFWLIVLILFSSTTAEFSVSDWGAILSRDNYAIRAPFYLLAFIVFQAGIVLSRFLMTRMSSARGEVVVVRRSAIASSVLWGASIQIAAHMSHRNQYLTLIVVCIGFFAAGCGVGPVWPTMLSSAMKSHYPTPAVLSRLFAFLSLAFVFGPGVIGWLSKLTSLANALMIPVTALFVVGLLARKGLEQ
jgi:MFS family permease